MLRATLAAAFALATLAAAGCVILTGGTDGYQPPAICTTSKDCTSGHQCCIDLALSVPSILDGGAVIAKCGACGPGLEACSADSDCQGGSCTRQACSGMLNGMSASTTFSACALNHGIPQLSCVAAPADAADASVSDGAPDSSAADAGALDAADAAVD